MIQQRRFLLLCALVAVGAILLFVPALSGDFVLDDGINILQNRLLYVESLHVEGLINAALSFHDGRGGRPLPMLSFAVDHWRAGGMDPRVFKTTNLLVHGLTIFSVCLFLRRLLKLVGWQPQHAVMGSLVLASVWAIHPMHVSSVMYVVQRMQTMETLFLVLALWAYLGMRQAHINGAGRGRGQGLLVLVFWLLALACKEDAPILFAFLLALELTVLRFRAVQEDIVRGLKQSYLLLTVLSIIAYIFIVVPHYWSWDAHSGRSFSSPERLLTQARVLMMYLGQILYPHPDQLTFIYDQFPVSRSLWQPWTTLPSILLIVSLLAWAWCWRNSRPLFCLGILLFFFGHFITSNVIALELVFEHRNHFPLIGIVLAVADLLLMAWQRWSRQPYVAGVGVCIILIGLGSATLIHAYTWGDPVRHGEKLVELLPTSPRAWVQLGGAHFDRYNATGESEHLVHAIAANEAGLENIKSPSLASNLVIYKSLLGTVSDADWERFEEVLRDAPRGWQNKQVVWTLMNNVDRGFDVDPQRVAEVIEILPSKGGLHSDEYLRLAVFVYKHGDQEKALPHFIGFAKHVQPDSPTLVRIISELEGEGHSQWAELMRDIQISKTARSVQ